MDTMPESTFVSLLGNKSFVRLLDALLERLGQRDDFDKNEIQTATKLSESSMHNHWGALENYGLLIRTRKVGNTQMYNINTHSQLWKKLVELDVEAAMQLAPVEVG